MKYKVDRRRIDNLEEYLNTEHENGFTTIVAISIQGQFVVTVLENPNE